MKQFLKIVLCWVWFRLITVQTSRRLIDLADSDNSVLKEMVRCWTENNKRSEPTSSIRRIDSAKVFVLLISFVLFALLALPAIRGELWAWVSSIIVTILMIVMWPGNIMHFVRTKDYVNALEFTRAIVLLRIAVGKHFWSEFDKSVDDAMGRLTTIAYEYLSKEAGMVSDLSANSFRQADYKCWFAKWKKEHELLRGIFGDRLPRNYKYYFNSEHADVRGERSVLARSNS